MSSLAVIGLHHLSVATKFTHYDHRDRCLVSEDGWRLPVIAMMYEGEQQLRFVADNTRMLESPTRE